MREQKIEKELGKRRKKSAIKEIRGFYLQICYQRSKHRAFLYNRAYQGLLSFGKMKSTQSNVCFIERYFHEDISSNSQNLNQEYYSRVAMSELFVYVVHDKTAMRNPEA